MKKILLIIYEMIYRRLVRYGLVRTKSFVVNNKKIIFHDIGSNGLLEGLAVNGFDSHENEVVRLIKNYSWGMTRFYDVGSNIGYYPIVVNSYHSNISVIAVEPFPLSAEYINTLKHNNKLSFEIIEKAIDITSGETKSFFFPVSKNSSKLPGSATLINSFKGSGGVFNELPFDTVNVETITLDDLMKDNDDSALIKLDCEGNELNILKFSSVLERENVDFIIEIMINDSDKNEVFDLMIEHGYNGYLITNAGLIKESRPLTLPRHDRVDRTLWRNHFFTKKPISEIKNFSIKNYGHWI
jgi:FkbM family methyltransferase